MSDRDSRPHDVAGHSRATRQPGEDTEGHDPHEDDPDEELTGSSLVPSTRAGALSVRLATAMLAPVLLFYMFGARGLVALRAGMAGLPLWLLLGPAALMGLAAAVTGVFALAREERALLVYLSASLGATVAVSGTASILRG